MIIEYKKADTSKILHIVNDASLKNKGFNFMDSPGYDPVSVTGQVASGANVICFTTGRGSSFGCKPVPSLKLSTNSAMYEKMSEDMDINCGTIAEGEEKIEEVGEKIFELQETVLQTNSLSIEDFRYFRFFHFLQQMMWGKRWYYFYLK